MPTANAELVNRVLPAFQREAARRWLAPFCSLLDPSYAPARHTSVICENLERLERGEIDRLAMFMPPRHSKTYHVSQRFPAWYLGRHPEHQLILASYGADLAESNSRVVRNLLGDERYPFAVRVAQDSSAVNKWSTNAKGTIIAAGVGGAMTGFGAHLLVIDDPVRSREDADSETIRAKAWDWYTDVARTRLMPGGKIVLCQTRWHEDDLAGRILSGSGHWTIAEMPAIDDVGVALWPEWFNVQTLDDIREDIGNRAWSALYQQRPTPEEGGMFKRAWFAGRYDGTPACDMIVTSVDSAFKTGVANDYSVIATWGVSEKRYHCLDVIRKRLEYPDLRRAIIEAYQAWKPHVILIEDTAAGQSVIQDLQRETRLPIVPTKVTASKEARAQANAVPAFEAGLVDFPNGAPWINEFTEEHIAFPNGRFDDTVDTSSMALERLRMYQPQRKPAQQRLVMSIS